MLIRPDAQSFASLFREGISRLQQGDFAGAHRALSAAHTLNPLDFDCLRSLGFAALRAGLLDEALLHFRGALNRNPRLVELWHNAAAALYDLKRYSEAVECFRNVVRLDPLHWEARNFLGSCLEQLRLTDEAHKVFTECYHARKLRPEFAHVLLSLALRRADWSGFEALMRITLKHADSMPFINLSWKLNDPELQFRGARRVADFYTKQSGASDPLPARDGDNSRLRIAYISADFRNHPMARFFTPLIQAHDRSRVEVFGVSLAAPDDSADGERIIAAFDSVFDASAQRHPDVIRAWCREKKVDVVFDMMGYSDGCLPGIFVKRAAPIQISCVGDPSPSGAPWMDYVIADDVVLPPTLEPYFTEKPLRLPHCYHPPRLDYPRSDSSTRAAHGLPNDAVVFMSMANTWKLNPSVFDVWMEILRNAEGSVLWVAALHDAVPENLRGEARRRGIDPARIVFADRVPLAQHIERQRHADLALDTWPYGGYTTAFEALYAGVPVVTWLGRTFASRITASLLKALGLNELIAADPEGYAELALTLAKDASRRAELRARIRDAIASSEALDAKRYARDLEDALLRLVAERAASAP